MPPFTENHNMSQTKQKHVVILSGAGISAESGVETFRAADGLWANHSIEDVAEPETGCVILLWC
jgi:NAD-dependent deacetylase